ELTGGGGVRATSAPSLAVDGKGGIHVVFAAVASGSTLDRSDIFYVRSIDNGTTFGNARKLNDDGTSTSQAFPAVAATADGTVPFDLVTSALNGFSGPLALSVSPAVDGLSYAFSSGTIAAGQGTRLTVSASAATGAGPHHLTVTASSGGVTRATTLWLEVYD